MPLFVKNDVSVLFIHVPKTGGSSIEHFFMANGFHREFWDDSSGVSFNHYRQCSPQHMHADQLRALVRFSTITYTFMTVRHPLTRLLSEFRMRVRDERKQYQLGPWVDKTFRDYIDNPYIHDNHIRPQSDFLIPGCEVFRQERGFGPAVVSRIEERIGMALQHRQVGNENPAMDLALDDAVIDKVRPLVRQFYRRDFATFGYKPGPGEQG